ncbi:fimbria/pilus outer membrane usher protein [Aquitalea sp. USM4]|uniref:fimbria/pilus outer membrane usher protein n=1 Tax=Aquitalea sp. USM4 TaxID=1590041 RepID=UPI00103FCFE7|nr:fimbria/pilus outer membrane usher protein [Aquitalea sp. USM4]QBJ77115.1 fimbrial protein [Aquitalea sp. USM4]
MTTITDFKQNKISLLVLCALSMPYDYALAGEESKVALFDKSMLWGNLKELDISKYEEGNIIPDGTYSIDIVFNDTLKGRYELAVKKNSANSQSMPCISRKLLITFGVKEESLPPTVEDSECIDISKYIPDAFYAFDTNDLSLRISVPQIDVKHYPRDYSPPEKWEAGIPAFLLDYNGNTYFSKNNNSNTENAYLSTKLGFNFGEWQFRNTTSISWDNNNGRSVVPMESYVKKDIDSLRAQLVLGDSFTDGDLFDSVSLRGLRLVTDDRMKPVSQTGYAPIVRGIANSNAVVTIKQNGYVISETTVAPGAFEISDIPPGSYNGDLDVTVTEADGKKSTFTVPFSAVPRSMREGSDRFNFNIGKVRNLLNTSPMLGQFTYQRGLSNLLTGNTGLTLSEGYTAFQAGTVFNTSLGAIGVDATHSNTKINDTLLKGQSYRFSFNKLFLNTGTNVTLAAYRYSTSGYFSVRDGLNARDLAVKSAENPATSFSRLRSRAEININQTFNQSSSVYLNASVQNYWNSDTRNVQYQAGFRKNLRWGSIGVSVNQVRDNNNNKVATMMFNLSINMDGGKSFSSTLQHDTEGNNNQQVSLSGNAGEDKRWSYNINANRNTNSTTEDNTIGGSVNYSGSKASVNATSSVNKNSKQLSLGVTGSVLATTHGIFFGQSMGESAAIVEAKDAEGAEVMPAVGVKIDRSGYALLPSLSPYKLNDVQLQTGSMNEGVELQGSSNQAVPRSGAVVYVNFKTSKGLPILFKVTQSNGEVLPFGTDVMDENDNVVGNIGQNGKLLARVKNAKGTLHATLNNKRSCRFSYSTFENSKQNTLQQATCNSSD